MALATQLRYDNVHDVEPKALQQGDLVLDSKSRVCSVRENGSSISLVKPRSGSAHTYSLPTGGKVRIVGVTFGGWTGLKDPRHPADAKPKAASKPQVKASPKAKVAATVKAQPKAEKAQPQPKAGREVKVAAVLRSIADLLDS